MKDESICLGHIRDAIGDIRTYASVGEEAFLADRMRQDAIIRKLEIIGEAVKQLSDEMKARRPEIPWKQIAGMRDRLTHAYSASTLVLCGVSSSGIFSLLKRPSSRWQRRAGNKNSCICLGQRGREIYIIDQWPGHNAQARAFDPGSPRL